MVNKETSTRSRNPKKVADVSVEATEVAQTVADEKGTASAAKAPARRNSRAKAKSTEARNARSTA